MLCDHVRNKIWLADKQLLNKKQTALNQSSHSVDHTRRICNHNLARPLSGIATLWLCANLTRIFIFYASRAATHCIYVTQISLHDSNRNNQ